MKIAQIQNLVAAFSISLFASAPSFAASEGETMDHGSDAELYDECQRLLDSGPLNELHRHVSEGRGSEIADRNLGKSLIGVKCRDAQIIGYMETHGFQHTGTRLWPEIQHGGAYEGYNYNKILSFCTPRTNWLDRWFSGKCLVGSRFTLLDNTIVHISGAGNK